MTRKLLAAALLLVASLFAPMALAQTATPFGATAGSGLNFGAYKPDGTNLAGWTVAWCFNGTSWVLCPADTSGRPYASVVGASGAFASGSFVSGAFASGAIVDLQSGSALLNELGTINTSLGTLNSTVSTGAIPGGTNTIGYVGGSLRTSGGWTYKILNGLSSATAASIKGTAGQLGGLQCYNPNTSPVYIQLFDATSVTIGTNAPVLSIPIAAGSTGGLTISLVGVQFNTGIMALAFTTATGTAAPATAPDCNAFYN